MWKQMNPGCRGKAGERRDSAPLLPSIICHYPPAPPPPPPPLSLSLVSTTAATTPSLESRERPSRVAALLVFIACLLSSSPWAFLGFSALPPPHGSEQSPPLPSHGAAAGEREREGRSKRKKLPPTPPLLALQPLLLSPSSSPSRLLSLSLPSLHNPPAFLVVLRCGAVT